MATELKTINRMLSAAGLAPVADNNTQHPSYKRGKIKLDEVSETVQSQGYWFNSSTVTLRATVDGQVYKPQKAVHVNTVNAADKDIVLRGSRMYDLANRTYVISRDLECSMVEVFDYEELPPIVADYIAARAVHEFYVDAGGQDPKLSEYRGLRQVAEVMFKKETLKNHRPTQKTYSRTTGWNKLMMSQDEA